MNFSRVLVEIMKQLLSTNPIERISASSVARAAVLITDLRAFGKTQETQYTYHQVYTGSGLTIRVKPSGQCGWNDAHNVEIWLHDDLKVFKGSDCNTFETLDTFKRGTWLIDLVELRDQARIRIQAAEEIEYQKKFGRL